MERSWVVLGWVGLVPFLAALDATRSFRGTLAVALLMAAAFTVGVFGWFASAIETYTGTPLVLALVLLALAAPLVQPQLVSFALARWSLQRRGAGFWRTTLITSCVWVATEWATPKLFGDTLGHGLYGSRWMRQAADLGGAHGLTLVLLIANACVLASGRMLVGRHRRGTSLRSALAPAACAAALALALLGYGGVRARQLGAGASDAVVDGPTTEAITVGVVQADISHYDRLRERLGTFGAVRMILDAHFGLSTELLQRANLDVLIWPETVYPTTFGSPKSPEGATFDREIVTFVTTAKVPLVFGAYDAEGEDEFNAAFVLEPAIDGRDRFESYRKATLFPLTERVPFLLDSDLVRSWLPWLGTWTAGSGPTVLTVPLPDGRRLRIAPLICYDVLDASHALEAVRRGAELIVTLSNDSWFASGVGPRQHLVGAVFRSIETRRPQVRATNTGISAVIDPFGDLVATAAVHERATLVARVTPDGQTTTLMVAWGEWLGPAALVLAAALALRPRGAKSST